MFRKNLGIWIGLAITINGFVFLSIQNFRGPNPSTETNFEEQLQSVQHSFQRILFKNGRIHFRIFTLFVPW